MGTWIFGYGSLVWRPAFEHIQSAPAYIDGFERKFWQASPVHRGTARKPGRVVTLLPNPEARCWGMAYQVRADDGERILRRLDHRERTGYEQVRTTLHVRGVGAIDNVLLYVAGPDNPNYVGPEHHEDTMAVIRDAKGESGTNIDYLQELTRALREMQVEDPHIEELARLTERRKPPNPE